MTRLTRRRATAAALALAAAGCGGDRATGPAQASAVLTVVTGGGADTVSTREAQAVAVRLTDPSGHPLAGRVIRFTPLPTDAQRAYLYVTRGGAPQYGTLAIDTTDAQGEASATVTLGEAAGPAQLTVSSPEEGVVDTVTYAVLPGAATQLVFETRDTAVYVSRSFALRAATRDRYRNERADAVTFSLESAGAVALSGSTITSQAIGTTRVIATFAALADTVQVSVVPHATFAAFRSRKLVLIEADGSGLRVIADGGGGTTSWSPGGDRIVYDKEFTTSLFASDLIGDTWSFGTTSGLEPRYSPDGAWIYYTSANWRLRRVRPDGTGDEALQMLAPAMDAAPAVSPDGSRVVYTRMGPGGADSLAMLDVASGASTPFGIEGGLATWSPSGDLIAFIGHGGMLTVMQPDGSNRRVVGRAAGGYVFAPSWSPDGAWLVARGPTLDMVDVATGAYLPLGAYTSAMTAPAWRP